MGRVLEIRLVDQRVGWLEESRGVFRVRFNRSWKERPDRRVFSLSCEVTGNADIPGAPRLPTWFENLRFEGDLRSWIFESEAKLGRDDFSLLARVGLDLLGAATVHPIEGDVPDIAPVDVAEPPPRPPDGRVHWSLAGVQLKLNLAARGDRFTLPVHGELGHFIAKLADRRLPGVPANEHATMSWARAAGLRVAEARLIGVGEIDELPDTLGRTDEPVLLVRRFDRDAGQRIHAEEFAQALGLRPDDKYRRYGWRHHLILLMRAAPADVGEYLRRLVFVIASGNADAHHKNWSFVYLDGRRPQLAPAYDQVSVVALGEHLEWAEGLPFPLAKSRRWELVRLESMTRLLDDVGMTAFVDNGHLVEKPKFEPWIREQVTRFKDALASVDTPAGYRPSIERHWARTPLFR